MESIFIILLTPVSSDKDVDKVCDCSFSYGCRIKGALLEGYMEGVMVVVSGSNLNE